MCFQPDRPCETGLEALKAVFTNEENVGGDADPLQDIGSGESDYFSDSDENEEFTATTDDNADVQIAGTSDHEYIDVQIPRTSDNEDADVQVSGTSDNEDADVQVSGTSDDEDADVQVSGTSDDEEIDDGDVSVNGPSTVLERVRAFLVNSKVMR